MNYQTSTIDTVIKLKSEFEQLKPLKSNDQKRLDKKLRLEFNYNSNHLEGNTLTYGQTQLLLYFDKSSGDVSVSDIEEMKAHDVALSQIKEMASDTERPLTEMFLKELNKIILVKSFWKDTVTPEGAPSRKRIEIGNYKTLPNSVQLKNGEIHEYASPEETPALMAELIEWYNSNLNTFQPIQLAAEFHYKFVCIHPFDDGNGRVARLIMNYILIKNDFPQVVIKSEDKEAYLTALQKADTGDVKSLIEYIELQAIWSLELSIKAANGQDIDELGDIEKEIEILKREKLTKSTIYITPKVAYQLFNHINSDLWSSLDKALSKFDDFFAETSNANYIDYSKVEEKKTIRNSLLGAASLFADKEVVVKKYEIFGHDLEEEKLDRVEWEKRFLSLKSADKKIDFSISCVLLLEDSSYKLKLTETNPSQNHISRNGSVIFDIENEYKTFLMSDSVENIVRLVSNHMIERIKESK